jgi:ABC-type multidrug transport system, ATPase and permease components
MADVLLLQLRFSDVLNNLIRDSLIIVIALLSLCLIHLPSACVFICIAVVLICGMGRVAQKISRYAASFQEKLSFIIDHIWELRRRLYFISAQSGIDYELSRFASINDTYYQSILKSIMIRVTFAPFMEFIGTILFSLSLWLVSVGYLQQTSVSHQLFLFLGVLAILVRPLKNVGEQISKYKEN